MKVTVKNATNSVTYNVKYLTYGKGHDLKSAFDCSYVEGTTAFDYEYVTLYITDNNRVDIRLEKDTQIIITKS